MRLPQTDLAEQLPTLVPAMLSCCDDDAGFNRFKAKVRVVVERLVKRCGWSAVEAGPARRFPPRHHARYCPQRHQHAIQTLVSRVTFMILT